MFGSTGEPRNSEHSYMRLFTATAQSAEHWAGKPATRVATRAGVAQTGLGGLEAPFVIGIVL